MKRREAFSSGLFRRRHTRDSSPDRRQLCENFRDGNLLAPVQRLAAAGLGLPGQSVLAQPPGDLRGAAPDYVVINARVFTSDPENPSTEALQ